MIQKSRVLIVEDQESERSALERVLRVAQYDVVAAASAEEALDWRDQPIDLVISDLRMGGRSGIDLLMQWREIRPETPFILATAFGDVDSAVRAMKLGAADYLTKPVDLKQFRAVVASALGRGGPSVPTMDPSTLPSEIAELAGPPGARPMRPQVPAVPVSAALRRMAGTSAAAFTVSMIGTTRT